MSVSIVVYLHLLLYICIYCIVTVEAPEADSSVNICEAYLKGSYQVKMELEKKYGENEVKKLVEEHCSGQWLEENSKRCPHCFAPVEVSRSASV